MDQHFSNTPNSPIYLSPNTPPTQDITGLPTSGGVSPVPFFQGSDQPTILLSPSPIDYQQNTASNYQISYPQNIPGTSTSAGASPEYFSQASGHQALFPSTSPTFLQPSPSSTASTPPSLDVPGSYASAGTSPKGSSRSGRRQMHSPSPQPIVSPVRSSPYNVSPGRIAQDVGSQMPPPQSLKVVRRVASSSSQRRESMSKSKCVVCSKTKAGSVAECGHFMCARCLGIRTSESTIECPACVRGTADRVRHMSIDSLEGDGNRQEERDLEPVMSCGHSDKTQETYCDCCKKILCQDCTSKNTRHRPKVELYRTQEYLKSDVVSKSESAKLKIKSDLKILKEKHQKTTDHINKVKMSELLTSSVEDLELLDQLLDQATIKRVHDLSLVKELVKMSANESDFGKLNSLRTQIKNLHLRKVSLKIFVVDDNYPSRTLCDVLDALENEEVEEEKATNINRFVAILQENFPTLNYDDDIAAGPSTSSGVYARATTSSGGTASLAFPTLNYDDNIAAGPSTSSGVYARATTSSGGTASWEFQTGSCLSAASGASALPTSATASTNKDWVTAEGKWTVNSNGRYQEALEALKNEEKPKEILVVVPPRNEHSESLLRRFLFSLKLVRCELKLRCLDSFYQGRDTDVDKERLTVLFGDDWEEITDGLRLTEFVGYLEMEDVARLPCTLETIGQHFKTGSDADLFCKHTPSLIATNWSIKIHVLLPPKGLRNPVVILQVTELIFPQYSFVVHVPYVTKDEVVTVVRNYEMKGNFLGWPGTLFLPECQLTGPEAALLAKAFSGVEKRYTGLPAKIYFTAHPFYTYHQQGVKAALEKAALEKTKGNPKVFVVEEGMSAVWDIPV